MGGFLRNLWHQSGWTMRDGYGGQLRLEPTGRKASSCLTGLAIEDGHIEKILVCMDRIHGLNSYWGPKATVRFMPPEEIGTVADFQVGSLVFRGGHSSFFAALVTEYHDWRGQAMLQSELQLAKGSFYTVSFAYLIGKLVYERAVVWQTSQQELKARKALLDHLRQTAPVIRLNDIQLGKADAPVFVMKNSDGSEAHAKLQMHRDETKADCRRLLMEHEVFARFYAQFMVYAIDSRTLVSHFETLLKNQTCDMAYPLWWSPGDFAPMIKPMVQFMEDFRWLTSESRP